MKKRSVTACENLKICLEREISSYSTSELSFLLKFITKDSNLYYMSNTQVKVKMGDIPVVETKKGMFSKLIHIDLLDVWIYNKLHRLASRSWK